MTWLSALIRPDLRAFSAYTSARTEAASATAIALDANESPWPPFGKGAAENQYHRYPDPQPVALRQRLATLYGVGADQLLLTRGSDEGIDVLIRLFCQAGRDQILICPPTFGMYTVYASVQGAATLTVPLAPDYQLDVPAILQASTPYTKLIFIPSPNAPMGQFMRQADLRELCAARAEKSLIIVDEAYVEFTEQPEGMIADLAAYPNMVILRTLSKAHALAGERVGCVIGSSALIEALKRILAPYPLSQSSIRAALDTLSPNGVVQNGEYRRVLATERVRMASALTASPFVKKVFPSVANFLLLEVTDSKEVMARLERAGIRARDRHRDVAHTVRVTMGAPEENDFVLRAFGVAVSIKALMPRIFSVHRGTKETSIDVTVNLDAPTFHVLETGIGFFDHMLAQIATHGGFGLALQCKGDLHIDQHHAIEDCALALGEALKGALGDKRGLARFGFNAPLDEALAEVVIDLSGRPFSSFDAPLTAPMVGGLTTEMVPHFFQSLATALGAAIHIKAKGENTHHIVEACFKAVGRALRQAFQTEGSQAIPSTKGML